MSAAEVLAALAAAQLDVAADGDQLELDGPLDRLANLDSALVARVRAARPKLLRVASGVWRQEIERWPAWRVDFYEERAAIRWAGGMPADFAERLSYLDALEQPEPPAAPELPPGTDPDSPEAAGFEVDAPIDLPVEPCPGCGTPTTATSGLGFCHGCGWVKLPPPLAPSLPVATLHSRALAAHPPAQGILAAAEAHQAPSSGPSAHPAASRRRRSPPAPAPPTLSPAGQAALDAVLAMVSAEIPGVMLLEIRPIRRRAPAVEAPVEADDQAEVDQLEHLERPRPNLRPSLPPLRWQDVLSAMPPTPAPAPWAPMANPLDAPPRRPAIEIVTKEKPEAPVCLPPVEPPAGRAARFGYAIAPDGSYIEAHQAHAPRTPPFLARFDTRWRPSDEPAAEAERQQQRGAAAAYCGSVLGPPPGVRQE